MQDRMGEPFILPQQTLAHVAVEYGSHSESVQLFEAVSGLQRLLLRFLVPPEKSHTGRPSISTR
jgi:hypothetical protein